MRLYEATGVGTMLLTDEKSNLHELFELGREVETYAAEDELVEKIRHYLDNDVERRAIALAGQEQDVARAQLSPPDGVELAGLLEGHSGRT